MLRQLNTTYPGGKRRLGLCTTGVRGDAIPRTGALGGAWMAPSVVLPADAAKEYAWWVVDTTFPPAALLALDAASAGTVAAQADGLYTAHVQLEEWGVPLGQPFTVSVRQGPAPAAPSITLQPQSGTVVLGQRFTVRVEATGPGPLSYQCRRNGVPIPGATTPPYLTPPAVLADQGAVFDWIVTNPNGATTSDEATMSVIEGLDMYTLRAPQDQVVNVGGFGAKDPLAEVWLVFSFKRETATVSAPVVTVRRLGGAADTDPAALLDGQPVVSGPLVLQHVKGGVDLADYEVTCVVQGVGTKYVRRGVLPVRVSERSRRG